MNPSVLSSLLNHRFVLFAVGFGLTNCYGTEGDNPFAGPVDPSPCKGQDAYASYSHRIASFTSNAKQSLRSEYASIDQALVARSDMPIGLQCLTWDYADGKLELGVHNFAGGCAIGWEGGTRLRDPGDLLIQLDDPNCAVAGCGWCFYDSTAELSADLDELLGATQGMLDIELALNDCDGDVTKSFQWQIPLRQKPSGVTCEALGASWVEAYNNVVGSDTFNETQLNLYAQCETGEIGDVACTEDRTCVEGHCVPACTTDGDCPLAGALTCQNGSCNLAK